MNSKTFPFILFFFALFFACKRPPASSVPSLPPPEITPERVNVKNVEFAYFKSRSKITYTEAAASQNATVDIRIKRDSVIWLSLNKVGIEGARTLITRDSIFIIDRLNNDFLSYDFVSLSKRFNFPITFDLLQAAILGNLLLQEENNRALEVIREKDFYLLKQSEDSVTINQYVSPEDFKVKKVLIVEKPTNNSLSLSYENFNLLDNFLFPYTSQLSLNYQSQQGNFITEVSLQHQKAELSDKELKFPFAVPLKYERKK